MDAAVAALRRDPARTGLFLDFDGTLAPIAAAAEDARPLPVVGELLHALQHRYAVVAIVSGRPVGYLIRYLPPSIELHALYGLESRRDGIVGQHPDAVAWQPVVEDVASQALAAGLVGVDIEHKGLSLTLHFRRSPGEAATSRAWATQAAAASGLEQREAKMSVELHPPIPVDKGTVVLERSVGLSAACYVGDDVGDLPAFDALDELTRRGVLTVKVTVRTAEVAPGLLARADVVVDGPQGACDLLARLS